MKIISYIIYPLKNNPIFFVFLYLLGIITTIIESLGLNFKIPRFNFFSWFLDAFLLCLLLEVIPKKIKPLCKFFILFLFYILSIIDIFCVETFRAKIGLEILNVVLETNTQEASEFMDKYFTFDVMSLGLCVVLFLMALNIATYLNADRIKKKISIIRHRLLFNWIIIISKLSISLIIIVSFYLCLMSRIRIIQLIASSNIEEVDHYISNYSENTPLNNLIFSIKMRQIAIQGLKDLIKTQNYVTIDSCNYTSPHIVLIIGESYIKSHSQLYGYQLQTTPRQMLRQKKDTNGVLIPFKDVISPSNLTSIVFKNVFSLRSIEDTINWSKYPLFPVIFRKAGYSVTFITNQFVQALNTDIFNISGGLFINDEKISKAQFDHRNLKTHQYDIDLLSDYDSLKTFNGNYQLTIFHLAGQHIDFEKRCPPEMKNFKVSDYINRKQLSEIHKQLVADYDNATYYNDYVVDSIIKKYEKEDAIIVYMPDHGEECFDELQRMGRLPNGNYYPAVLRQEYRIPFWIWCSNKYIENHSTLFEQIKESRERPFMTDDLPHLLIYIAGIHCKYFQQERCLISKYYNSKRRRLIEGKADYDLIVNSEQKENNIDSKKGISF